MIIDITTTAMPRPEILNDTYNSFTKRMHGIEWDKCTCYINIDLFPCDKNELKEIEYNRQLTIKIAKNYFGNVVANLPIYYNEEFKFYHGNYTAAYDWLWSRAQNKYILNLEDDWKLIRDCNIEALIRPFTLNPNLYECVLRAYAYRYPCTCTSPAILHERYYKAIGGKFDLTRNPETQTHSRQDFGIFIPNKDNCKEPEKYIATYPNVLAAIIVKDNGREWLENSPYIRPQMLYKTDPRYLKKAQFTSWIKK